MSPLITFSLLLAANLIGVGIVFLPWPLVLIGLFALTVGMIILRNPRWGFPLMALALPFERLGSLEISGVTIRASQALFLLIVLYWFFQHLSHTSFPLRKNPLDVPIMLFVMINLLSLVHAENLQRSVIVLLYTVFTMMVGILLPKIVTTKAEIERTIRLLFVGAFLVGIFGIFQFLGDIAGVPSAITGLRDHYTKQVLGFPRIQSTALEPLYFANYLLLPLGLAGALFLAKTKRWRPHILLALLILSGTNLLLTTSRGGYLAFFALLLVVGIFYLKNLLTLRKIVAVMASGTIVLLLTFRFLNLSDDLNIERFTNHVVNLFYGPAYHERVETLEAAWNGFLKHPWVGVGVGGFGPYESPHPLFKPTDGWAIVNNEFVELLAETGILGFSSFLLILIILVVRSLKAIRSSRDGDLRAILVGLLAVLLGVIVQYQTFSTLYIMHIWFLVGMMVAVQNQILRPSSKPS